MELQLGLALPSYSMMGIDLNSYSFEGKTKEFMGSEGHPDCNNNNHTMSMAMMQKRKFGEAFGQNKDDMHIQDLHFPQTLPLFHQEQEHYHQQDDPQNNACIITKGEGDCESGVVGWPPVKSSRKKLCNQSQGGGGGCRGSKSIYVKVKMEGVGIARKVDLSLHHSYGTLIDTLIGMFWKCHENVTAYKLTFQDREGDWLLAEDVPWRIFVQSAQRLKLLKKAK